MRENDFYEQLTVEESLALLNGDACIKKGTVTALNFCMNAASVDTGAGVIDDIPIFYHCQDSATAGWGVTAFATSDAIIYYEQEHFDDEGESTGFTRYILGFQDKPKICAEKLVAIVEIREGILDQYYIGYEVDRDKIHVPTVDGDEYDTQPWTSSQYADWVADPEVVSINHPEVDEYYALINQWYELGDDLWYEETLEINEHCQRFWLSVGREGATIVEQFDSGFYGEDGFYYIADNVFSFGAHNSEETGYTYYTYYLEGEISDWYHPQKQVQQWRRDLTDIQNYIDEYRTCEATYINCYAGCDAPRFDEEENVHVPQTLCLDRGKYLYTIQYCGGGKDYQLLNDLTPELSIRCITEVRPEITTDSMRFYFQILRRKNCDDDQEIDWVVTGEGDNPVSEDEFPGGVYPSGTTTIYAGNMMAELFIEVLSDKVVEVDESFKVTISNPQPDTAIIVPGEDSAIATILDDDGHTRQIVPNGEFTIVAASVERYEGDVGVNNFSFTVATAGATDTIRTVDYHVLGVGEYPATPDLFQGGEFPTGVAVLGVGVQSTEIFIYYNTDEEEGLDRSFVVNLENPSSGTISGVNGHAYGIIVDDDKEEAIAHNVFGVTTITQSMEAEAVLHVGDYWTTFIFEVTCLGDDSMVRTVDWTTTGYGPSPSPSYCFDNYQIPSGTVTLQPGDKIGSIEVHVYQAYQMLTSSFQIELSNPSNGIAGYAEAVLDPEKTSAHATILPPSYLYTGIDQRNACYLLNWEDPRQINKLTGDHHLYGEWIDYITENSIAPYWNWEDVEMTFTMVDQFYGECLKLVSYFEIAQTEWSIYYSEPDYAWFSHEHIRQVQHGFTGAPSWASAKYQECEKEVDCRLVTVGYKEVHTDRTEHNYDQPGVSNTISFSRVYNPAGAQAAFMVSDGRAQDATYKRRPVMEAAIETAIANLIATNHPADDARGEKINVRMHLFRTTL